MDVDSEPVYRRGPGGRSQHYEENLEWFHSEREAAQRVFCRHCHAAIGQPCMNGPVVLKRFPAHPCRISDAKAAAELAAVGVSTAEAGERA